MTAGRTLSKVQWPASVTVNSSPEDPAVICVYQVNKQNKFTTSVAVRYIRIQKYEDNLSNINCYVSVYLHINEGIIMNSLNIIRNIMK